MSNYTNYFDLNGTILPIHDYGRDQPNGVPELDVNGDLPVEYLPETFASVIQVSSSDSTLFTDYVLSLV